MRSCVYGLMIFHICGALFERLGKTLIKMRLQDFFFFFLFLVVGHNLGIYIGIFSFVKLHDRT